MNSSSQQVWKPQLLGGVDPQLHCWLDHRDFHGRSFDGGLMAAIFDAIRWLVIGGESLVTCLGDGVLGIPGIPNGC